MILLKVSGVLAKSEGLWWEGVLGGIGATPLVSPLAILSVMLLRVFMELATITNWCLVLSLRGAVSCSSSS